MRFSLRPAWWQQWKSECMQVENYVVTQEAHMSSSMWSLLRNLPGFSLRGDIPIGQFNPIIVLGPTCWCIHVSMSIIHLLTLDIVNQTPRMWAFGEHTNSCPHHTISAWIAWPQKVWIKAQLEIHGSSSIICQVCQGPPLLQARYIFPKFKTISGHSQEISETKA